MKIITKGALPQDKQYKASCRNCGTLFEFSRKEAEYISDQRDGDCLRIQCPLTECKHHCYVQV